MNSLDRAIEIAVWAHSGQLDKAGAPYILHPLRVMLRLKNLDEQIVAVLHDVVEDSDWTIEHLKSEDFSENVISAIDALTRRSGESYNEFICRVTTDPIAIQVKLADLHDNSDLSRIAFPTEKDQRRTEKYQTAIIMLTKHLEKT